MLDIQKIIYESITNLGYTVYDYVKEDAKFPYVRISSALDKPNKTKTSKGNSIKQYIDVFSDYKGFKEVKEITNHIVNKLDGLNISGYDFTLDYTTILQEEYKPLGGVNKGTIQHSVMIFDIKSY